MVSFGLTLGGKMHSHKHAKRIRTKSNNYAYQPAVRSRSESFREGACNINNTNTMDMCVVLSSFLAFLLYINTIPADFAYDDSRAILKNPDLLPETPITHILYDDFWGTPLTHSGSHKSYRPLTVLTFRINYIIGGHNPLGYHLVNVILHAIATALFTHLARVLLNKSLAVLTAGLLFASHPVHTEAVAGVVGRADILACIHFILAFLSYIKYCKYRDKCSEPSIRTLCNTEVCTNAINNESLNTSIVSDCDVRTALLWKRVLLLLTSVFTLCALLSKEQGVTVLAVCLVYDVFLHSRVRVTPRDLLRVFTLPVRDVTEGVLSLVAMAALFVSFRVYFMGNKAPEFAPADNPASDCSDIRTRIMTFCYLPFLNFCILLFPKTLSFDWSMEAVPLVESLDDSRNVCTIAFYSILTYTVLCVCKHLNNNKAPAKPRVRNLSNSSQQYNSNHNNSNGRISSHNSSVLIKNGFLPNGSANGQSSSHVIKNGTNGSLRRRHLSRRGSSSSDSSDDSYSQSDDVSNTCYSAWQILVISLCILIVPFIPATNLFFYVGFVIAERVLYIPSMGFILLVAYGAYVMTSSTSSKRDTLRHSTVTMVLVILVVGYSVRTVIRNEDWRSEEQLYRAGIHVNPAKAWGNLANILNAQGKVTEAEQAYRSALQHRANMADVHYNLGILLQDQRRYQEAIDSYQMAIQCRPRLTMAHLNLGIVMSTIGKKQEAEKIYRHCAEIDTTGLKDPRLHENTKISALYNLGRLLADQERYQDAVEVYKKAITRRPSHYAPQSLYNMLGEAHCKLEQLHEAEIWYREALKAKPDHIPAHLTMGKLMQKRGKLDEAEQWFVKAKQIDAQDSSVYQHYGQYLGEVGRHAEAAENYARASELVPSDFELVFNTANAMRQAGRNAEAEQYYKEAVKLRPKEATAHMNLGAILHFNGKWDEAERSYLKALKLKPNDPVTEGNLQKLRNLIKGGKEST